MHGFFWVEIGRIKTINYMYLSTHYMYQSHHTNSLIGHPVCRHRNGTVPTKQVHSLCHKHIDKLAQRTF